MSEEEEAHSDKGSEAEEDFGVNNNLVVPNPDVLLAAEDDEDNWRLNIFPTAIHMAQEIARKKSPNYAMETTFLVRNLCGRFHPEFSAGILYEFVKEKMTSWDYRKKKTASFDMKFEFEKDSKLQQQLGNVHAALVGLRNNIADLMPAMHDDSFLDIRGEHIQRNSQSI